MSIAPSAVNPPPFSIIRFGLPLRSLPPILLRRLIPGLVLTGPIE